jgi:hypothetical protein
MNSVLWFLIGATAGALVCFVVMYIWSGYQVYKILYKDLPVIHALMEAMRKSNDEVDRLLGVPIGRETVDMPNSERGRYAPVCSGAHTPGMPTNPIPFLQQRRLRFSATELADF